MFGWNKYDCARIINRIWFGPIKFLQWDKSQGILLQCPRGLLWTGCRTNLIVGYAGFAGWCIYFGGSAMALHVELAKKQTSASNWVIMQINARVEQWCFAAIDTLPSAFNRGQDQRWRFKWLWYRSKDLHHRLLKFWSHIWKEPVVDWMTSIFGQNT